MTIRNVILAIKDQLPLRRLVRNLWKGHVFGLFHRRSHETADGKPKVSYNTKETARKSAEKMALKRGFHYSSYKCLWCNGYHLGRNRENKTPLPQSEKLGAAVQDRKIEDKSI